MLTIGFAVNDEKIEVIDEFGLCIDFKSISHDHSLSIVEPIVKINLKYDLSKSITIGTSFVSLVQ